MTPLKSRSQPWIVAFFVPVGSAARTETIDALGHYTDRDGTLIFLDDLRRQVRAIPRGQWACVEAASSAQFCSVAYHLS